MSVSLCFCLEGGGGKGRQQQEQTGNLKQHFMWSRLPAPANSAGTVQIRPQLLARAGRVGARLAKAVKNAFDMVPKGCQSYCQGSPQPISLPETPEYSIWVKDIFLKDFFDWTISQNYLKTEVRGNTALSGVREDNCMCYWNATE